MFKKTLFAFLGNLQFVNEMASFHESVYVLNGSPFYCDYTYFKTNKDCAAHSNLAEPESTSPIFMLKFLIIWSLLEGVQFYFNGGCFGWRLIGRRPIRL